MKQTFKSLIKNYIKDRKQVTLDELGFLLDSYNHAENKRLKFSTMERELRSIVRYTNRQDNQGNYIHEDLFGYRIIKTTNDKGEITGYIVFEKPKEIEELTGEDPRDVLGKELGRRISS